MRVCKIFHAIKEADVNNYAIEREDLAKICKMYEETK